MNSPAANSIASPLSAKRAVLLSAAAVAAFHLAYCFQTLGFLILVFFWCLFELTRLPTAKQSSYFGMAIGMLAYGPQLYFFWPLFGAGSLALWAVLAFWLRLFLVFARSCRVRLGPISAALLIPFLWTGLEYFRSELYYLRFSWLNAGYLFPEKLHWLPYHFLGMYGLGFALMAAITLPSLLRAKYRLIVTVALLVGLALLSNVPAPGHDTSASHSANALRVAGVQMEFPSETEVIYHLDRLIKVHPDAQLLVLSEYTFTGPVPDRIKAWCAKNHRYLSVGAKDPLPGSQYYDTAFVLGPAGDIIFRQGKCVPIQFFRDGLPAPGQKLWDSPWGKIGFCVCYDLSYTRVTDELIRLGAQAIIVPTMDVADWGRHQHELHARVAPIRAAEYGVPIFRLASSGISQCVNARGEVTASAPMPGDGAIISDFLEMPHAGALPVDRVLAPISVCVTVLFIAWLAYHSMRNKNRPDKTSNQT